MKRGRNQRGVGEVLNIAGRFFVEHDANMRADFEGGSKFALSAPCAFGNGGNASEIFGVERENFGLVAIINRAEHNGFGLFNHECEMV